jgi:hypothetical protein
MPMDADDPETRRSPDPEPRCSARGCRAAASIDLSWRNPALHAESRVKHWLSCVEHEDYLADFLARRGFLLGRAPL